MLIEVDESSRLEQFVQNWLFALEYILQKDSSFIKFIWNAKNK